MTDSEEFKRGRKENLARLFAPRSVAVVGASANPGKAGYQALKALSGFEGKIWPINPQGGEILGLPAVPRVSDVGSPVDLVIMAVPAAASVEAFADAADAGCGGAIIVSGGFAETGDKGAALQKKLADIVSGSSIRLLGPNTSGFVNPCANCQASFVPGLEKIRRGNVAVIAQSGGVNLTLAFLLHNLGFGISFAAGLGNAVDVGAPDVLDFLAGDPNTKSIIVHLEGIDNGRLYFDALRKLTAVKPIVAVVTGRGDVGAFAQSHTGKMLGSYERKTAMLRQAGAIVADSTEEAAEIAGTLSMMRLKPSRDPGIALVTGQAGPGLLIAELLDQADIRLASLSAEALGKLKELLPPLTYISNPVDTGRPGPSFPDVVKTINDDPSVDLTLLFALHEPAAFDPLLVPSLAANHPILFGTQGISDDLSPVARSMIAGNVPMFRSPERTARAAIALVRDARAQHRLSAKTPAVPPRRPRLTGPLNEAEAKALLTGYGIAVPKARACAIHAEAQAFLAANEGSVVVKVLSASVQHKTELGGVILNVRTAEQMEAALLKIDAIPLSGERGYFVEKMASQGIELIVAGIRDQSFGPIVTLGVGGVQAEAFKDTSSRLAPVLTTDVEEMIAELRSKVLLEGFRNNPAADFGNLARLVRTIGDMMLEHPEISELEINPLRITAEGEIALDALVNITAA